MPEPSWRWPDDRISLVVWAAAAQGLEAAPELAISSYRTEGWDAEIVRESYGLPAWTDPQMCAAAWAGMARAATERRDDAVRAVRGVSLRSLGQSMGLSHAAVQRILDR